jgi:hypothetical protein
MSRRRSTSRRSAISIVGALAALIAWTFAWNLVTWAQSRSSGGSNQLPRIADGKPDFSGMWDNPKEPGARGAATVFNRAKMAPFVPGGEALFYEPRTGDPRHDEPRAFCMPSGFPSAFLGPYPVQFIQTPQHLVMSTEFMNVTRIIPLDGRPHKTDIEPTFYGEPIGHWEGDTLVIETVNFNEDTWLTDDGAFHTKDLKVTERLSRNGDTMTWVATADDPKVLAQPWNVRPRAMRLTANELQEPVPCVEQDLSHVVDGSHHDNPR